MRIPILVCLACSLCVSTLAAQRGAARLAFKKSEVVVDYGEVRYGRHSLDELPVGSEWRMGMNSASTLRTDLPLVGEQGIVAPGSYRVNIRRANEKVFGLQVVSTQLATGGDQAWFPTSLGDEKPPAAKLSVSWVAAAKAPERPAEAGAGGSGKAGRPGAAGTTAAPVDTIDGKHARRSSLRVGFGPYRLDIPVAVVMAKPAKVSGFEATAFEWPAALLQASLAKKHAVPILTLRVKGGSKSRPKMFNLLVQENEAAIYPAMVAPTDSFGFGGVKGFDGDEILRGKIEWAEAKQPAPVLALGAIRSKQRQLELTAHVGDRVATITVPLPSSK